MRIVYFGSGEFGLPTLKALVEEHELVLVVTQPDRPSGRHRALTATPIGAFAAGRGIPTFKPDDPNGTEATASIRARSADAFVVIAYGHKLGGALLEDRDAVNLHASLLPKYRGAAPINWAIINGERETGVSVIRLAQRMDAGAVLAQRSVAIDPEETAGELHDRLALLGPESIALALKAIAGGKVAANVQDDRLATRAPKLSKSDGKLDFSKPARVVQARIHGLTPWPGCWVKVAGRSVRLHRVRVVDQPALGASPSPGVLTAELDVGTRDGAIRPLEVQPANGRLMSYESFLRGHTLGEGMVVESIVP